MSGKTQPNVDQFITKVLAKLHLKGRSDKWKEQQLNEAGKKAVKAENVDKELRKYVADGSINAGNNNVNRIRREITGGRRKKKIKYH